MTESISPQYFAGHLGHLVPAQQTALESFKDQLKKAQLYKPAIDKSPASLDDTTLLRFLRARNFDLAAAQKQLADTESWRRTNDVDNLYATFDPMEFEKAKRFYPRWTGRRDKNGVPVYVYRIASLVPIQKELEAVPAPRRYQRIIVLYELMVRFALPLSSHLPHAENTTPISNTTSIIDLGGVSFGAVWGLRHHMQEASKLANANYPETLGMIAIVNSPSFFPTIWGWIKGWFDEGTQKKIHILGKEPGAKLREMIDAKHLPREYGGELDWTFESEPSLDADSLEVLGKMPKGPVVFENGAASKPIPLAK